jgi:hypothetical protein
MEQASNQLISFIDIIHFIVITIITILLISFMIAHNRLRKKISILMNGTNSLNIEQIVISMKEKMNDQQNKNDEIKNEMTKINDSMKKMKTNIYIHRYNAYSESGNNLSFSLAILDDYQNGVVISSIHNRESSFIYAKPIKAAKSEYSISPEEKIAIEKAMSKTN